MLFFTISALLGLLSPAYAWDSVAVFHRPDKVVVQINEHGANSRLQNWLNQLQAGNDFYYLSSDQSVKLDCGRNESNATCTFRFLPSAKVLIGTKDVRTEFNSPLANPAKYEFKNSNGDQFIIAVDYEKMVLWGSKK